MSPMRNHGLGWSRERGVAGIMAMIFLLVVVGFSAVTLLSMSSSDLHDTTAQNDGVAALFLAESGIERASQLYSAGTACGNGLLPAAPINLGRGSMQATGVAPTVLSTTSCRLQMQGRVGATTRTIQADLERGPTLADIAYLNSVSARRGAVNNNSLQWNHTIPPTIGGIPVGPNRIVIVGVSVRGGATVTGGTYNGVAMTMTGSGGLPAPVANGGVRVEWLYAPRAPTGTRQIRVSFLGSGRVVAGALAFSGVDQVTPIDASASATGSAPANPAASVTPVTDKTWIVDVLALQPTKTATANPLQTNPATWRVTFGGAAGIFGAGSYRGPISPAVPTLMRWQLSPPPPASANAWAQSVLALRPNPLTHVMNWSEK